MRGSDRVASRHRNRRQNDVQMQDQATFRDDYGFNMTEGGYKSALAGDQEFATALEKDSAGLNTADASLTDYDKKLKAVESTIASASQKTKAVNPEDAFKTYESGFKDVRVYNGESLQGTYRLPKNAIDNMHTKTFNKGEGSYVGNWKGDDVYNVDVKLQGGNAYGKELHESLASGQESVKNIFFDGYTPTLANPYGKNPTEASTLATAGMDLQSEEAAVASAKAVSDWAAYERTPEKGKHYKGNAAKINEKKAANLKILKAQRDIMIGKRKELEEQRNLLSGKRDELNTAVTSRQAEKDRYKTQHEESVANRQNLFALGGQ